MPLGTLTGSFRLSVLPSLVSGFCLHACQVAAVRLGLRSTLTGRQRSSSDQETNFPGNLTQNTPSHVIG